MELCSTFMMVDQVWVRNDTILYDPYDMGHFQDSKQESIYSGDEIELLMTNEKINSTYESSG